jgi:starch phosphorylase
VEGFTGLNGWAIPLARPEDDANAVDAEHLYALLEREVVPLFYERDERGIPLGWIERMKHALHVTGARFTAQRAVQQYVKEYYAPAMQAELGSEEPPDDPPTAIAPR